MAFIIKQNDTRPKLVFQLVDGEPPTPVDLTTATAVKVILGTPGVSPAIVDEVADIIDAEEGICEYDWAGGGTEAVMSLKGEAEVEWADGGIETFPNEGYFDVTVTDDLG